MVLTLFILIYLNISNKREAKYDRWRLIAESLVRKSIFFEPDTDAPEESPQVFIAQRVNKLLPNPHFRKLLTDDILSAKESLSGSSGDNLKHLYLQLGLHKHALTLIKSRYWHKKATGIKEVGLMEFDVYKDDVEKFTNDKRGLVRIEAQNTMIRFNGFNGLNFLDTAKYPITEWQQIKLLEQLAGMPPDNFKGIEKWLTSENESVVIFALKLARTFHTFELHDQAADCLKHSNAEVRRQAIMTLKEIQTEESCSKILDIYPTEDSKNQLAILDAMKEMGSCDELFFLIPLLNDPDHDIKLKAATAMAHIKPKGLEVLLSQPSAGTYPLNAIIEHVKLESE